MSVVKNCITENRVGYFVVSEDLLREASDRQLALLWGNFIIIESDFFTRRKLFQYTACSTLFERVVEGGKIPFYDIKISKENEDYQVSVSKQSEIKLEHVIILLYSICNIIGVY